MKRSGAGIAALLMVLVIATPSSDIALAGDTPIKEDARVYFIWPKNGQVIKGGKLWVRMGLRDAGLAPAGVDRLNTGHHHLIVDADLPPFDEEIPSDRNHFHMGKGHSEYRLILPPGKHTLQMLFADKDHIPHNPPIFSKKITIIVPE